MSAKKKTIDDLREDLFETIKMLKEEEIDIERAKVICDLSQVIVNSAKVEVDFQNKVGGIGSGFMETNDKPYPTKIG